VEGDRPRRTAEKEEGASGSGTGRDDEERLIPYLREKARALRRRVVRMLVRAGSGHPGGSLSATDIVAALYFDVLRVDPANPSWEDRDRFVLSKGHACPILYAALAERGFYPEEWLESLRTIDGALQGHPDMKTTPGVEMSTGSLGQGLSAGVGMALAGRLDRRGYTVYVLLGDGEVEEGQVWEAAMAASHYGLDNIVAIVDHNGLQIDGPVRDVMSPLPLADKWRAFGWETIEIDGHDFSQILPALRGAREATGPFAIVARTVKGKGVSFMENQVGWHGKAPRPDQLEAALADLEGGVAEPPAGGGSTAG